MYAAPSGHLAAVGYLLTKRADPHVIDDELWNCLHYSCFNGHKEITAILLDLKFNTDLTTMFEEATPLGFATHRRFSRVAALFNDSPRVVPFTEVEAQEILDRSKKKLAKGRMKATAAKFLIRYELRDDAFDLVSLFLEKVATLVSYNSMVLITSLNVV